MRPNKLSSRVILSISVATLLIKSIVAFQVVGINQFEKKEDLNQTRISALSRDVFDLKLSPDFRAVNLSWSYKHDERNVPVSFDVRFCEVTSWNIEIKCRHKELPVLSELKNDNKSSVIIKPTSNNVRQLPIGNITTGGFNYEAQVYDLRALTNYTFQVRVSRFAHEKQAAIKLELEQKNSNNSIKSLARVTSQAMARRIDLKDQQFSSGLNRIETKPFAAEATKCLADVTEVVINTGKFFGGRISAENSLDPSCSLLGNKTSEQSSYLLRIDHEICNSKIMDGNRIETMVLVHENKDILTHNSARFLVLCNFHQKSYTLKASVALGKVNGVMANQKPAVITLLPGKPDKTPNGTLSEDQPTKSVMLGSMPGIYRARTQPQNTSGEVATTLASSRTTLDEKPTFKRNPSNNWSSEEENFVEDQSTNTIEKVSNGKKLLEGGSWEGVRRKPKELEADDKDQSSMASGRRRNLNFLELVSSNHVGLERARPKALEQRSSLTLPKPVQIQSKVLYVDRSSLFSKANLNSNSNITADQSEPSYNVVSGIIQEAKSSLASGTTKRQLTQDSEQERSIQMIRTASEDSKKQLVEDVEPAAVEVEPQKQSADSRTSSEQVRSRLSTTFNNPADAYATPIIMTNNHRIAGDFTPLSSVVLKRRLPIDESSSSTDESPLSIKYSAAQINEYPVESIGISPTKSPNQTRTRNGRMRSLNTEQLAINNNYEQHNDVNRMGDLRAEASEQLQERHLTELEDSQQAQQQPSLAHNITSYLLRWSLKTLTNIAKKSFESLVAIPDNNTNSSVDLNFTTPKLQSVVQVGVQPSSKFKQTNEIITAVNGQPRSSSIELEQTSTVASLMKPSIVSQSELHKEEEDSTTTTATTTPKTFDEQILTQAKLAQRSELEKTKVRSPNAYSKSLDLNRSLVDSTWTPRQNKNNNNNNINNNNNNNKLRANTNYGSNQAKSSEFNQDKAISSQLSNDDIVDSSSANEPNKLSSETTSSATKRSLLYSSWLLQGIILFISIVTGISVVFWLLSLYSLLSNDNKGRLERRQGALRDESRRHFGGKIFQRTLQPIVQFQLKRNNNNNNNNNNIINNNNNKTNNVSHNANSQTDRVGVEVGATDCHDSSSYQKYDYGSSTEPTTLLRTTDTSKYVRGKQQTPLRPRSSSPSVTSSNSGSRSTRSTSANSSSCFVETECKNNELLYTEHVLINTGAGYGESFA